MDSGVVQQVRAGLDGFAYNDYLRVVQQLGDALPGGKPLRVAILRSYTVEPIEPVLRVRFLLEGYAPEFWVGGFNQFHQEILDPASPLREFGPDLVLLLVRLEEVIPEFVSSFSSRGPEDWRQVLKATARELGDLSRTAASRHSARVIIQGMSLWETGYFGAFGPQRPDGQEQLVQELNRGLAEATDTPGVYLWDFDGFVRAHGRASLYDPKMWYVSRNPFRQASYPALGGDLMRSVLSAMGRIKKCVAVDLDNTLWGGIVGEDGFEGIKLGESYPGNCFKDFQRRLLRLYDRGILLALNSKNNEADALRVIDDHPDMVLRRRHFAAMRVNWRDKASNLRELAKELNIGLDSFIFLDDNPVECELVRREIPECDVVQLPDKPYLIPGIVDRLPGVENIRLTEEDRKKGEMYRAQAERRAHEERFAESDIEGFLRSLEMEATIEPAGPFSIPRIAQLTQKTNQWNMTTRRYSEAEIQAWSSDPGWGVYSVGAKDRFGDHGIIGVLLLRFEGRKCRIDSFLLSCRVIGRGIENSLVAFAAEVAQAHGATELVGEFIPTAKNAPASGFYEAAGFERAEDGTYRRALGKGELSYPEYVKVRTPSISA